VSEDCHGQYGCTGKRSSLVSAYLEQTMPIIGGGPRTCLWLACSGARSSHSGLIGFPYSAAERIDRQRPLGKEPCITWSGGGGRAHTAAEPASRLCHCTPQASIPPRQAEAGCCCYQKSPWSTLSLSAKGLDARGVEGRVLVLPCLRRQAKLSPPGPELPAHSQLTPTVHCPFRARQAD
jgi:hypothetical protein